MTPGVVVLVLSDLLVAVVLPWVTARAADGRIPVNALMGIRTRATMETQRGWEAAHVEALPIVRVLSQGFAVAAVLAVGLLVVGYVTGAFVVALVPVAGLLVAIPLLLRRAGRAARDANASPGD